MADVVLKALAPLVAERSAAGSQISFPVYRAGGIDDRPAVGDASGQGKSFVIMDMIGGGMGASARGDGMNAVDTHAGNCGLLSAEVMETFSAVRVLRTRLVPGSGGDGTRRGGLAIERDYQLLCEQELCACQFQQASEETAPWGAHGGKPGARAAAFLNPGTESERQVSPRFRHTLLRRGDVLRMRSAGGGGYGDPALRGADERERDRTEGYV